MTYPSLYCCLKIAFYYYYCYSPSDSDYQPSWKTTSFLDTILAHNISPAPNLHYSILTRPFALPWVPWVCALVMKHSTTQRGSTTQVGGCSRGGTASLLSADMYQSNSSRDLGLDKSVGQTRLPDVVTCMNSVNSTHSCRLAC